MSTSADLQFEAVAHGFYLEALLIDGDDVWYTDVVQGGIRKVGSSEVLLPERTMIGGLQLNDDGSILAGGAGGIAWADPLSGRHGTLLEIPDGVNEMRADRFGGLYFGTTDLAAILRGERPGPSSIQHLSAAGEQRRLWDGLSFANGLAVSPDGATLFFNESFTATRAFPINTDGSLSEPRTLIEMYDCDGMALDHQGNVWVTGFASNDLRCVTPEGEELRRISLPGKACTNVRFGGLDRRDLFVTIVDPQSAQALAAGIPLTEQTSTLFRMRSPVPGGHTQKTSFKLKA